MPAPNYAINYGQHEDAGKGGGDAGPEQAEHGEWPYAVDEQPVAHDVEHVGTYHDPHRSLRVSDAVEELFEGVEERLDGDGGQHDEIIWAYFGQEFFGLSHAVEEEIKRSHQQEQPHAQ